MSRIGKKPITLPKGVKFDMKANAIKVTGQKGTLQREILPEIELKLEDGVVSVHGRDKSKRTNAFTGLTRSLINNMVIGVSDGFQKKLVVEGVGYKVSVAGKVLTLNVGYSNPVEYNLPDLNKK